MSFRNYKAPWAATTPKPRVTREELARAIEEHYRPRYAGDALPSTKIGQAVALADKIDTLVGIFAIEQRPTGAKDPFGLRRAALGLLRILLEGRLDLDLLELLAAAAAAQPVQRAGVADEVYDFIAERLRGLLLEEPGTTVGNARRRVCEPPALAARRGDTARGAEGIPAVARGRRFSRASTSASRIS